MPAIAFPDRLDTLDPDLEQARESLSYWEGRAHRLPRHAVRKRREAREMARRWQVRVTEIERAVYGRGLLGALLLLAAERRLPQPTRQAGRVVARRTLQAATLLVFTLTLLTLVAMVAFVEAVGALL